MQRSKLVTAAFLSLTLAQNSMAQVVEKKSLTIDGARAIIDAAVTFAKNAAAPGGVIAVVDDGGNLMALERLDGTFAAGASISIGKARTAALFKKPTRAFEEIIGKGRTAMTALPDFTPLQGGVPVIVADQVIGAVGVSGAASAQQDEEIALAGAKAASHNGHAMLGSNPAVAYFDSAQVEDAFSKGSPIVETGFFKVHASRRDAPGKAEVHARDTDIIHVIDGTATFVTGGGVTEGKPIALEEIRGSAIEGGDTRRLAKGDVVIVPSGVPHWFKEVNAPFTYYVVKVRSPY